MRQRLRARLSPLLQVARATESHALFTHAAATAFFLFLSLPPALLALIVLVGMVPVEEWTVDTTASLLEAAHGLFARVAPPESADALTHLLELHAASLFQGLQELTTPALIERAQALLARTLPRDVAASLGVIVENILGNPRPGLLTASFLVILWSASGATRAAMRALGSIYEVRRRAWYARIGLGLALTLGFLFTWTLCLAVLPISNALVLGAVRYFGLDAGWSVAWGALTQVLGGLLLFLSVLVLNRLGPDVSLRLRALTPGSLFTVALWIALTWGLGLWMERSYPKYNATYGALAGVIVLLLWCYLLSLGLLLGAELNTAILRWRRRAGAPEEELGEATRAAVAGEVVVDPLAHVVTELGRRTVGRVGAKRGS